MDRRESIKLMLAAPGGALLSASSAKGEGMAAVPAALAANGETSPASREDKDAGSLSPVFEWLTLGEVKPAGWIREQMLRDLDEGFAGCLDQLCPQASSDIFVTHRIGLKTKGYGGNFDWWNGEIQGNWRAGFIMMAYLSGHAKAMREADHFVQHILSSQGSDGYLGAFDAQARFTQQGELWTQNCLLRGLLDYAELTGNAQVLQAATRAADLSLSVYGSGHTSMPFKLGHDMMISDVMERLYGLSGQAKYRDFTLWLYQAWSDRIVTSGHRELGYTGGDVDLASLLNRKKGFRGHGVTTYEWLRVPLWLWYATGREDLGRASRNALDKLHRYTEPSGSAVSEEFVKNLPPNPTYTEYEYCASKEIQLTLESALQKTGAAPLGDGIERLWFNAAQGARLADGKALSYLTADNRLRCDGFTPDGTKPEPRNKFSPTHEDVAVCCNPNATNVAALFVRGMWMRHRSSGGLAALLYGPARVSTRVRRVRVKLEEKTRYPFENSVEIEVRPEQEVEFPLFLRDPAWSRGTRVACAGARVARQGDYWVVSKTWKPGDRVEITFTPVIREVHTVDGQVALQYGALLFAQAIEAVTAVLKTYPLKGFEDTYYEPAPGKHQELALPANLRWQAFGFKPAPGSSHGNPLRPFDQPLAALEGTMINRAGGRPVPVSLVPLGNAPTLRRLTFPLVP